MLCIEPIGEPCWTDGRTASLVRAILEELHSKELCKSEDFTALGTLRGVQWVGLGSNLKTRNRAFWLATSAAILLRICWEQQHRTWRVLRADGSTAVSPCGGRNLHSNSAMLLFVATVAYLFASDKHQGQDPRMAARCLCPCHLMTGWAWVLVRTKGGANVLSIWLLRFRRDIDYDDMILAKPDLEGKEQQWVS